MKFLIFAALAAALIGFGYLKLTRPVPLPSINKNKYWGPGDSSNYKEDKTIKPFKLKVNREVIDELQSQLNKTFKLSEPLEGVILEYGSNSKDLKHVIKYWRDNYLPKWSEREKYLNTFPQYTTEIQGLNIHYIHAKPNTKAQKTKKVLPLLLLHGWPLSVRELYGITQLLITANEKSDYVFEVIAPSLVGFAWSDAARKPGMNAAEMAIVMRNLMTRLKFEKFLVQGGDWGSIVGSHVATIFPENVLGYHSNMCVMYTPLSLAKYAIATLSPHTFIPSPQHYGHNFPLLEKLAYLLEESGYYHIQATKPDTIGTALTANPIGLASYFLEKFQTAARHISTQSLDGLEQIFTLDAYYDNLMIYYLTNCITSSARLYKETMAKAYFDLQLERVQTRVPMGCARFHYDLPSAMDWQLRDKYTNVVHSKYYVGVGHYAPLEAPGLLYEDIVEFVKKN
ncbi:juvenile hormone epoxide hydrolase 1 [Stomoxys calcitrans]|uniref:juvenile hormone epoxide hydrolase 1 n=1 Tax=Stomoxys calcitrans TaxID=35570 RepID=UPI0027E30A86|nr:juvenile hormone epoxide hydrolase 1 [Stomoxys calcitrans]